MVNTFKFWFVLILVMIAILVGYIVMKAVDIYPSEHHQQIKVGGDFELLDQNGKVRTNRDFHGKFMMVYFGYRHCPDICPTALTTITEALDLLGPKAKHVQPLFITIDPERDTVKELAEYIQNFHHSFLALTGNAEQVEKAMGAYRIFAQKNEEGQDYSMDHSSIIYVMDRQGNLISHFSHSTSPEQIAEALRRYL